MAVLTCNKPNRHLWGKRLSEIWETNILQRLTPHCVVARNQSVELDEFFYGDYFEQTAAGRIM